MNIRNRSLRFSLMLSAASFAAVASYAAAPAAGSKIGNQASATYLNAAGDTISVTSNKVETTVQQVAGVTLVQDNTESVAPGGKVFLPHTVTNDGNGADFFNLTAVEGAGAFDFVSIKIFPDADFDGIADSTTEITATPTLAAGETYGIVIEATVPSGAAVNTSETISVDAVSDFDTAVTTVGTDTDTDTVTITSGPVTEIVKSMTVTTQAVPGRVSAGDVVTVKLTYSSTGLTAATDLVVTDPLNQYLDYVPGSGRWSDDPAFMTDASGNTDGTNGATIPATIEYSATSTPGITADTVVFDISSVPSGRTGFVTFEATILAGAPAGDLPNTATQTVGGVLAPPSNTAKVTVDSVYAVTAADAVSSSYLADPDGANLVATAGNQSVTDDDGLNDTVLESADVSQGAKIKFEFVLTNHSNVEDTINVSFANGTGPATPFPTGTTFAIVGADGATPVVGPLGPLATGASTRVNVIATLPTGVAPTATTNYSGRLTAQSTNGGPTNFATALFTGDILGATVDLENVSGVAAEVGDGPEDNVTKITGSTDPGVPFSFPMLVQNGGPTSDTYDLSLDTPLPAGWTVSFQLPDGTPITNTGVIPGGGEQPITVIVTPPAGSPPVTAPVKVKVASPTTLQGDTLTNAVTVNTIVDVAITSDQSVQVAPGGIADIAHTLTNEGNVDLTAGAVSLAGFSTFSGTVFWDQNNNGIVDATDPVFTDISQITDGIAAGTNGLAAGDSISLIHRVQVPSNGAVGLSEAATITVASSLTTPGGAATDGDTADNAVTDTVTIVSGDMTLVKLQALDADCNGGEPSAAFVQTGIQAAPGQCIRYRITADNTGTADARTVKIADTIPGFTKLTLCGGSCPVTLTPAGSTIAPAAAEGATGALESSHDDLTPGQTATLEFTVRIDDQ